jgi:hypothetical protein
MDQNTAISIIRMQQQQQLAITRAAAITAEITLPEQQQMASKHSHWNKCFSNRRENFS